MCFIHHTWTSWIQEAKFCSWLYSEGCDACVGQGQDHFWRGSSGGHCCVSARCLCHVRAVSLTKINGISWPQTHLCGSSCEWVSCVWWKPGMWACAASPLQTVLRCGEHCSNSTPHMHTHTGRRAAREKGGVGVVKEGGWDFWRDKRPPWYFNIQLAPSKQAGRKASAQAQVDGNNTQFIHFHTSRHAAWSPPQSSCRLGRDLPHFRPPVSELFPAVTLWTR